MKIILICQAGTDMVWESRYDADSFERAIETERGCFAVGGSVRRIDASAYRVYTGTSRACMQTAEILFERTGPIEATPLLDDVPIRAFRDTGKALPLWLWKAMGEAQWRADSRRQVLLEGGGLAPKPLERVRATKKILHCGGCHHNCLLSEAKCHIGREKARERGIVA